MNKYVDLVVGLIIMVAMAAAIGLGYYWGSSDKKAEWDAAELKRSHAEMLAVDTRLKSNAEAHQAQVSTNVIVKKEVLNENQVIRYERDLANTRGLRLPATACPGPTGPAEATSTSGNDAGTAGTGPLPEIAATSVPGVALPGNLERDLLDLAEEADRIVASCRGLQKFVRENGLTP